MKLESILGIWPLNVCKIGFKLQHCISIMPITPTATKSNITHSLDQSEQ